MATMQKPKQKKKKKPIQQEPQALEEDKDVECSGGKELLDFPISSTNRNEILSHECFVSPEFNKSSSENSKDNEVASVDNKEDTSEPKENDGSTETENCLNKPIEQIVKEEKEISTSAEQIPTAPNFDTIISTSPSSSSSQQTRKFHPAITKYPDLAQIRELESTSKISYSAPKIISKLKPFTTAQLKELYSCMEIEAAKQFEMEFLTNSLQDNYENDPLYCLLLQYSNLRSKLRVNLLDLENIQSKIAKIEKDLWVIETKTLHYSGTCMDNNSVHGTQQFDIAVIKENNVETMCSYLNELRNMLCFSYTTNVIYCEVTKLKIEQIIREILSYPALSKVHNMKTVALFRNIDPEISNCIAHLRRSVSILFVFIRRPFPDKEFSNNIKHWITLLLALHLRVATKEDHWFFLFQVLRCPSGVSQWAAQFIQIPLSNTNLEFDIFTNLEVNHCVSVLKILLMPIKKRNEFLTALAQSSKEISDPIKEDQWILVDSDGEDSTSSGECPGLKESDLIALLNQIPFEEFFRTILKIKLNNDNYVLCDQNISGKYLLKLIAFFSSLVEIFGEGLLTYNTEKYKQFTKRLGRLIRHTIQYLSDFHNLYLYNQLSKDPQLCERIKIEFDAFVIKSCGYIYQTRNLGTWQYFSSIPFSNLDISTCWHLFYCLSFGFSQEEIYEHTENLQGDEFWKRFNVAIADISQEDMYYLLQTFSTIAMERDRMCDWNFIQHICTHIFNIGFVNIPTKETCYKNSRDVLVGLCQKYPELISHLLTDLRNNINDIESSIYLFKSLPLNQWQPELDSFHILSSWLLNHSYEANENILARIIISHLNWEFDSVDGQLFLPHEIHVRMACLVCEAANKHAPETIGYSSVSESVRQVSSITENQTSKEQFTSWCWSIIATLRLHLMDQSRNSVQKFLQDTSHYLNLIPELEKFEIIFQGVTESRPLSIYVSLLISLWGHSIPLICQKGFAQLKLLLNDYRHAVVVRCLYLMIPLFLECPEALIKNDSFTEIMKTLLNADRTYIKMAKELITSNSPGPVLELLSNMIQSQIINYSFFCLPSPTILIELWLQILTSISNWSSMNVPYLIEMILRIAYQFPESWHVCQEHFRHLFKSSEDPKTPKKKGLTIFLGSSNQIKSLPAPSHEYPWLSLLLLELEYEIYENKTGLWAEFLRQLTDKDRKISMDNALKKATLVVGCSNFQTQFLVLYKIANLIVSIEISHHLFPIICQEFFSLYLARVPFSEDELRFQYVCGVSDKFYEYNISLMKKVKGKLKSAEEYYVKQSQVHARTENLAYFYTDCSKMMKSYLLWLEETSINNISVDQNIDLPPQFRAAKLKDIFNGNMDHWTEFIHLPNVRKEQTDASSKWMKTCFRYTSHKKRYSLAENKITRSMSCPIDRIKNHLKSYDKPLDPPDISETKPLLENLTKNKVTTTNLAELRSHLKVLGKTAGHFTYILKELSALSGNYRDLIKTLYANVPYQVHKNIQCSKSSACLGAASIAIELYRPVKNENVQRKIENNRERHDTIVGKLISQDIKDIVMSIRKMEHTLKQFVLFQLEAREQKYDSSNVSDIAIQFFYDIIRSMDENITTFPPTNELCTSLLSELGVFIRENQETQGVKILETILKRPELLKILAELFVPSKTSPEYFLAMYKFLIDSHMRRCDKKILFVLFSKFDVQNWLQNIRPKLNEINRLLQLIQTGLENWNQPETALLQDLFRRHFIQIFEHEFPEHYGEVLQIALSGSSEQRLMPVVLLDLINSILTKSNCEMLTLNANPDMISQEAVKFATQQNLFNFKGITDTIALLARHFQNERLHHGLHGLYPKHKKYCTPLSIWFSCFGHAAVASAIYSYPGVLSDQICDWVFAPIVDLYSPWLVTYTSQNMQQATANWIRQLLSNGKILHPWSERYIDSAQSVTFSFVSCLQYILDSLPVSSSILGHVLNWYDYHFAKNEVNSYVRTPIHSALISLPWNRFQPHPTHIEVFHKVLQEYLPECHSFLGYIFSRVQWTNWMTEVFPSWNLPVQERIISQLLTIFIQISFEPHLHDDIGMSKILEEALDYPWNLLELQGVDYIFNWLVLTVDPVIVIKLPSECNNVDLAVLELLKQSSSMLPATSGKEQCSPSLVQSKRILYTRTIVRLLRTCSSKHQKLLATKEGLVAYQNAIVELMEDIEKINKYSSRLANDHQEIERNILNIVSEVICSLSSQNESTSKLFVDAIIVWQSKCDVGSRVNTVTLNALGLCKSFIFSMYSLLEATIFNYFRSSDDTRSLHSPSWISLMQRSGQLWSQIDLLVLLKGCYLLSLHGYIAYKMQNIEDIGEKITFLEDLSQLLESVKTNEMTEPKIAIIWGSMIVNGCKILETEISAKKPLLMLARYLQTISTQSEGWSEGLLGVIGLKKDNISNRRKILTRCLSCIIFSLFPDKSTSERKPSREFILSLEDLKNVSSSKKYADVKLLSTKVISMIENNYFPNPQEALKTGFDIICLLYNENYVSLAYDVWQK